MPAFPEYELDLVRYAQVKGTVTCLAHAGFPQLADTWLPPPDRRTSHLQANPALFGPTSQAHARTRGFGPGPNSDWQPPHLLFPFNGRFGGRLARCQQRAWRTIGPHARTIHLDYLALSGIVSSRYDTLMTDTIRDENLNVALLECLTAQGYTVLDRETFLANPFPGHFGIKTGVQVRAADPPRRYVPTPEEAEFAVAFARCNRETGRLERLLARSRQAQDMIMRNHRAEMTVLNAKLAPLARRAAALTGVS